MAREKPVADTGKIYNSSAHYYYTLSVPVIQFQGEGEVVHCVRWTGKQAFRKKGKPRVDWVWVRRRERVVAELQVGQLDGKTVGRLEGLFSVRDHVGRNHEVALVELLRLGDQQSQVEKKE
ncbi:hypothetical protein BGX38DRAFT_1279138 [Terfezia claveryi]|nr:hypothetical protein BGX38DRAFT_1279138 [Terfezia claveryi]